MSSFFTGWDIGGAHLKAALLNSEGEALQVLQLPCHLWKGLNQLENAINDALRTFKMTPFGASHVVTMTGELVDLFPNRHTGVIEISTFASKLLGKDTLFYAANEGFVPLQRVSALTTAIASTNWHASASALAMQVPDALLIDIGSTTTDIIAIERGQVKSTNLSDAARLADDSLVYTGVVRTPLMALGQKLLFEDTQINVAAEYFATMADVYRLTGELLPEHDMAETTDGKSKSALESARRLARMIGHDAESKSIDTWKNLANTCRTMQLNQIKTAVQKHLKSGVPIIGAGVGSFLVKQLALDLGHEFIHACKLPISRPIAMRFPGLHSNVLIEGHSNVNPQTLETCFPAYAVARLLHDYAETRTQLSSR